MIKKLKILSLLLFFASFCFGQESNYEIIQEGAVEYEFNNARNLIYILTEDGYISVYDTEKESSTKIALREYHRPEYRKKYVLYLSETDTLFVFGAHYIYKIFENSLVENIPCLLDEGALYYNRDSIYYDGKDIELNEFLSTVVEAYSVDIFNIFTNSDGEKIAISDYNFIRLNNKEDSRQVSSIQKNVRGGSQGEHHRAVDRKGRNSGGKKKQVLFYQGIEIQDKIYSCTHNKDYTQSMCKYKMKIIAKDKTYILDDKIRRHRYYGKGFGKHIWTCDLLYRAPVSSYITDKRGTIYILFDSDKIDGGMNLIKLL